MLKTIFMIFGLVFLVANQAQAFDDPWKKGMGFDDPFNRKPGQTPETRKSKPKIQEKAQQPEKTPVQRAPFVTTSPIPQHVQPAPPMAVPSMPPQTGAPLQAAPQKSSEKKRDENEGEMSTPMGHAIGSSARAAKSTLEMLGFTEGNVCGRGKIYFLDPANSCVAVGIVEKDGRIAGSGNWVSKRCLDENPYYDVYKDLAASGQEDADGYRRVINYPEFMSCVKAGGIGSPRDLPMFLGLVRPRMSRLMIERVLADAGGRVLKKTANGARVALPGITVFYECCPNDGVLMKIGARLDSDSPEAVKRFADMGIVKDSARFGNILVRSKREKGRVVMIQWDRLEHDSQCRKKV